MPDETYNDILGVPPAGGKAVAGMAPELQQQGAEETRTGKEVAGVAPENRNNTTSQPLEPITAAPVAQAVVQNPTTPKLAGTPAQPQTMTYTEMIQRLSPYTPPTPEELEAERKREKRERLWSAIGDGMAAVANLYFASQSGFSNYNAKNSMSAKTNARWDQLRKEREANSQRYLSLYMNARQADDAADRWRRDFEYKTQRDRERADEEARRWNEQWEYRKERDAVADERYGVEAERKAAADARDEALNNARIATETSRQSANYALAHQRRHGGGSGSGSGSSKKYTLQIGDEKHEYASVTDYNRDVEAWAEYYGIDLYTYEGTGRRKTQKRKPTAQLAAEVEKASGVTKNGPRSATNDEWEGVDGGGSGDEWDGVQ
ncbi:MAG: hypothetical protein IJK44_05430 [Bacteroidales bacterium]|nr:hypothetical protein [Bacteroidales bacterium]